MYTHNITTLRINLTKIHKTDNRHNAYYTCKACNTHNVYYTHKAYYTHNTNNTHNTQHGRIDLHQLDICMLTQRVQNVFDTIWILWHQ